MSEETVTTIIENQSISAKLVNELLREKAYVQAIGRRKTSVAQVRCVRDGKEITVNDVPLSQYFSIPAHQSIVTAPLQAVDATNLFGISVRVAGGGIASQAEAVRHGIARALVSFDPDVRTTLKRLGFLKRDPRAKERKKPGLRKARKSPQWSKR